MYSSRGCGCNNCIDVLIKVVQGSWAQVEVMQHLWTSSLTWILLQCQNVSSITQRLGQILRWIQLGWNSTKSTFQQKKNRPIRSPHERVLGISSQVCVCSPKLNPEHGRLGLYFLLAQKWRERTFWTSPKLLFFPYLHMWIVQMSIHLQLDKTQKCVKYFCSG